MTIAIYRNGPSEGANNLQQALGATMLRTTGSRYRGRNDKLLINWGSSSEEAKRLAALTPAGNVLNQPEAVAVAVNKLHCLQTLQQEGVPVVPFFTDLQAALVSVEIGRGRLYARTKLTGSSGEGIELIVKDDDPQLEETRAANFPFPVHDAAALLPTRIAGCRLFTQGIMGRRNEFRVQVVRGEAILTQKKMKRNLEERTDQYTSLVRNVETGWIYSVNFERVTLPMHLIEDTASAAIASLGLDFGAVDIIQRGDEVFVLEVNTAPGLGEDGSALRAYTEAFQAIENNLTFEAQA